MSLSNLPASVTEFLNITKLPTNSKHLFVLNFKAVWCNPCKAMVPHIQYLQKEYSNHASFYMIDIEDPELEEYPLHFQIAKVPTFILIKNGNIITSMIGTDKQKLEDLLNDHI